ncbi:MAG: hypothetical protein ACOH1E_03165 [Brevundimonas sp.]
MSKKLASVLTRTVIGIAVFVVVVFAAGIAAGYLSARGTIASDQAVFWLVAVVSVSAMVGAMAISVAWMRSIDEAAREAHKAAWFWGGCGGMAVGGVLVILTSLPQAGTLSFPSWLDGRTDPAAYAATGAFAIMLLMLMGYAVVWAWWWITRMRD